MIQVHRAEFKGVPVLLIGQQSGPTSDYKVFQNIASDPAELEQWNHGMPTPASYEKAIEGVSIANTENRIIIIFVDTPGADPTEESEAGGIAWKIGGTIQALVETPMPTISLIINRSHDRHHANEAAEISQITSREGFENGIVDELIPESNGPAHRNKAEAIAAAGDVLEKHILAMKDMTPSDVSENRINRWAKMGQWDEGDSIIRTPKSRIPIPSPNGFIHRHKDCKDESGKRVFDPVSFDHLFDKDFVCDTCDYRYIRLSAWDYIDLILDKNSFIEHNQTSSILDKDILNFPGYGEKLNSDREKTGLPSAMISGDGKVDGQNVVFCANDFGFLGGSFCMSTGEKIWRAAEIAIERNVPMVLQAAGGGARMHAGCSSMVSIPKAQLAISRVERAGLKVVTIITDPTLGGVAIGYGSRGIRLFESGAGNIGFSGKRVVEQYVGHPVSKDFQKTSWLTENGHANHVVKLNNLKEEIARIISEK